MTNVHDGLAYTYPVSDGPCADCGALEPCMAFEGRMLCYEHWHGAREKTQCYRVERVFQEGWDEACRGFTLDGCYTKEEAGRVAREMAELYGYDWVPVPWPNWCGARLGHPGYLAMRRAIVRADLEARGATSTLAWMDAQEGRQRP